MDADEALRTHEPPELGYQAIFLNAEGTTARIIRVLAGAQGSGRRAMWSTAAVEGAHAALAPAQFHLVGGEQTLTRLSTLHTMLLLCLDSIEAPHRDAAILPRAEALAEYLNGVAALQGNVEDAEAHMEEDLALLVSLGFAIELAHSESLGQVPEVWLKVPKQA
jgi:hypothetical protein|tara:strand:+ start:350 stop:841 length:492 start_codon:yes stop_codon:yes gene_type:complete